jgi:hypothetical protein
MIDGKGGGWSRVLAEKDELVKQLIERCDRQEKRLIGLLAQQSE